MNGASSAVRFGDRLRKFVGIEEQRTSFVEKLVSAAGGFLSILLLALLSETFPIPGNTVLVSSMGASAVLLFAVPHGPLSQPWPVFGGHLISALIGVACARWIPLPIIAGALAVGVSIGAMYFLRCLHPPGGATALFAVIGGLERPGFEYVLSPVLVDVVIILSVATVFNFAFPWRRYPVALMTYERDKSALPEPIRHESFVYALSQLDTFLDASEHDILRVYDLALGREREASLDVDDIRLGSCYCNGRFGDDWWVRQIVDEHVEPTTKKDEVIYKTVAGKGRRQTGIMSRGEFARLAKYEVYRDEDNWRRICLKSPDDEASRV